MSTKQFDGFTVKFAGRYERQRAPRVLVVMQEGGLVRARWQGLATLRKALPALAAEGYTGKARWSQKQRCWVLPVQQDKSLPLIVTVTA